MEIKISERLRSIFGIKICNYCQGVRNFLENNPFIFKDDKGKLKGLIFVEKNHEISFEEVQACIKNYAIPGLDCLVIVSDKGFDQGAKEFANSCSTPRVQLANRSVFAS